MTQQGEQAALLGEMSGATVSDDGRYRYALWRRWGAGMSINLVMLNPSTADGSVDDPTIRRCIHFARAHRAGALVVTNLFALRATNPRALLTSDDPIGPDNDAAILAAAAQSDQVVAAWGAFDRRGVRERAAAVLTLLAERAVSCLGTTRDGWPSHPLYLPNDARMCGYRWRTRLPAPDPAAGRDL